MYAEKKFNSSVWKVVSDTQEGLLALELRNKQLKQVEYGFLKLDTGFYQKITSPFEDPEGLWWTGLLELNEGKMLLHGYENPGLPVHKGVFAFSMENESILWSDSAVLVKQNGKEGILLEDGRLLDWENGKEIGMAEFHSLDDLRQNRRHYPSLFLEGSQTFDHWKDRLEKYLRQAPVAQLALLKHQQRFFIQAYVGNLGQELESHWLMYEPEKDEMVQIALGKVKGLLLDAFFIDEPYLFFMPEDSSVCWYKID